MTRTVSRQQGLSMVELMVALTLGLLLTAAVLQTFIGAKRSYEFQTEFGRMQENGRFAMNFITRAIREADFWGCVEDASKVNSILNAVSGASPTVGFEAVDGGSPYTPPVGPKPDVFTVRGGVEQGVKVITTPSKNSAVLFIDKLSHPSGKEIKAGDILMVGDCNSAAIFQVTNTNASNNTVVHNPATVHTPGNVQAGLGTGYSAPDAKLYSAEARKFWIRTGTGGVPALVRGDDYDLPTGGVELVEGVENMQLLLGYDTNDDGSADYYAPPPPTVAGDLDKVVSVQVSLVVRSIANNLNDNPAPLEFNGTSYAVPASDRYLRKVFTTNIAIRNRLD